MDVYRKTFVSIYVDEYSGFFFCARSSNEISTDGAVMRGELARELAKLCADVVFSMLIALYLFGKCIVTRYSIRD